VSSFAMTDRASTYSFSEIQNNNEGDMSAPRVTAECWLYRPTVIRPTVWSPVVTLSPRSLSMLVVYALMTPPHAPQHSSCRCSMTAS
jgi:hypothetical protein